MKLTHVLALVLLVVVTSSCATAQKGLALIPLAEIVTPENAEVAVATAVKVYEATLTQVNQAHARGDMSDATHDAVIARALTIRSALRASWDAAQLWRQSGARLKFDERYTEAKSDLETIAGGE